MKYVSLMYHNVHAEGTAFPQLSPSVTSYFTGSNLFRDHLKELDALGARTLSADDLVALYAGKPVPSPAQEIPFPALLTFDDGWRGTLDAAGPILESHNASAILFVTTDFIDRPLFVTRHDLQHLPQKTIQLGSHARSHRMLAQLSPAEITAELRDSKAILEDLTGRPINCLSIPGGAIDGRVRRIAVEVGYRFVFTSDVHVNTLRRGPLFIGRVPVRFDTVPAAVRRYVTQRFASERLRHQVLQLPKRILGRSNYQKLRRVLLREAPGQHDMLDLRATPVTNQE